VILNRREADDFPLVRGNLGLRDEAAARELIEVRARIGGAVEVGGVDADVGECLRRRDRSVAEASSA
jgi:hypothetical protein